MNNLTTSCSRRDLLRLTGGLLSSAALAADSARKRPNIILVLLDDLGYGQFGPNSDMFDLEQLNPLVRDRDVKEIRPQAALDAAKSATTNLTRLATEGTRFTDAYVACPLCAPSRSALMTSRYPQRFGGYVNKDIEKGGVPTDQLFPAQLLQKSGYRTAAIGKWHVAKMQGGMDSGAGQHPLERGFDYYFGFNSCCSTYYDATNLFRNREKASPEGFITDQFTEEAIRFIRGVKDKPFFLYLPYSAVHGPYGKPAPGQISAALPHRIEARGQFLRLPASRRRRRGQDPRRPEGNGTGGQHAHLPAQRQRRIRQYADPQQRAVSRFQGTGLARWSARPDGDLGRRFFTGRKDQPRARHLDGRDGHGASRGRRETARGLRDRRTQPAAASATASRKEPLHQNLFWAGQLANKWVNNADDEMTAPPAWATRKGRWMLRYWSHLKRHELYDLENDRGERHDVAAQHPDVVRDLKADYAQWFKGIKKPMAWEEQ